MLPSVHVVELEVTLLLILSSLDIDSVDGMATVESDADGLRKSSTQLKLVLSCRA